MPPDHYQVQEKTTAKSSVVWYGWWVPENIKPELYQRKPLWTALLENQRAGDSSLLWHNVILSPVHTGRVSIWSECSSFR